MAVEYISAESTDMFNIIPKFNYLIKKDRIKDSGPLIPLPSFFYVHYCN